MKRIVALMNEKNHYLEKFYALNEGELKNFLRNQFDGIEAFYASREKLLEIIKYIDAQIETVERRDTELIRAAGIDDRRDLRECLRVKDEYVSRIIEQDLQVLSCIEAAKNSLLKEMQDVRRGRKAVGGYRSPSFRHRLDEEA